MYHMMEWYRPSGTDLRGTLKGRDLAALGIPSFDEYAARYCERTGFEPQGIGVSIAPTICFASRRSFKASCADCATAMLRRVMPRSSPRGCGRWPKRLARSLRRRGAAELDDSGYSLH